MRLPTCLSVAVAVALVAVVSVHGQDEEVAVAAAEACVECSLVDCPQKFAYEECTWGRVRDPCHCCDECAKGPGEVCGGQEGTCLPGFRCIKRASAPSGAGRCEWRPLPTFFNPKIPGK